MTSLPHPSETIRAARRTIDGQPHVSITSDLEWFEAERVWAFGVTLAPDVNPAGDIPSETNWFVTLPNDYPSGLIKIFPAKIGGISKTYRHQNNNRANPDLPWRAGDLCLATTARHLGVYGLDSEPSGAGSRLSWHVQRALAWVTDASHNRLGMPGNPFELPHFPSVVGARLIFSEFRDRLWSDAPVNYGTITCLRRDKKKEVFVKAFRSLDGPILREVGWGSHVNDQFTEKETGVWLRLPDIPIVPPWAAPTTWEELRLALDRHRVDLYKQLRRLSEHIRDGRRHYLLLGFPIPETIGGQAAALHWQAIRLPNLSSGQIDGFRTTPEGYWKRDQLLVLRGEIEWTTSENWNPDQIGSRGHFQPHLCSMPIFIIGAGAVGSLVGELLVRGGARHIAICDPDELSVGNLVRHTLTLDELGKNKAVELAKRWSMILPHAVTTSSGSAFGHSSAAESLSAARLVIDCSGSDGVADSLQNLPVSDGRIFCLNLIKF